MRPEDKAEWLKVWFPMSIDEAKRMPWWKPSEQDWPECYEAIDLLWARRALEWGHAPTLARYLREAATVDPLVLRTIAEMINPDLGSRPLRRHRFRLVFKGRRGRPTASRPKLPLNAVALADLLDPQGSSQKWRLAFQRFPAGRPGDPDLFWRQHAIRTDIRLSRRHMPEKPSWAVEHTLERGVAKKRHVSRATAYRALQAFKSRKNKGNG
jgi:hypothetical protein